MNEWYAMTAGLQTDVPPLDEAALARIQKRVRLSTGRRLRRLAIALAAVLLLTACGYAAATQFSHWFWPTAEDPAAPEHSEPLLAQMGTIIGQSQTANGVTATLEGALWDGDFLMLSIRLEGDELPDTLVSQVQSDSTWLWFSKNQLQHSLSRQYPSLSPEELEYLLRQLSVSHKPEITAYRDSSGIILQAEMEFSSSLPAPELTLHLEMLTLRSTVLEGPYSFTFTLDACAEPLVYEGAAVLTLEDGSSITVTRAVVSPFYAEVLYTVPQEQDIRSVSQVTLDSLRISGTEQHLSSRHTNRTETDEVGRQSGTFRCGPFHRIVNPADVEALKLGNIWLELSSLEPNDAK